MDGTGKAVANTQQTPDLGGLIAHWRGRLDYEKCVRMKTELHDTVKLRLSMCHGQMQKCTIKWKREKSNRLVGTRES